MVTSLADFESSEDPHQEALLRLSDGTEAGMAGDPGSNGTRVVGVGRVWTDQPKHRKILGWSTFASRQRPT